MTMLRSMMMGSALALAAGMPSFGQDLAFTIVNKSSSDLQAFYVSAPASGSWGNDVLGDAVLVSGESGTITIGGIEGCDFDLRFELSSGKVVEGASNLCDMTSFTITD